MFVDFFDVGVRKFLHFLFAMAEVVLRDVAGFLFRLECLDCFAADVTDGCLLYTSPSPRDKRQSRMPSSA